LSEIPTPKSLKKSLDSIIDPELHVGIVSLGLIYDVRIQERHAEISMTWTSVACPVGPELVHSVRQHALGAGLETCHVEVTFQPQWDPKTMSSDEVKMKLGLWDAIVDEEDLLLDPELMDPFS
jgi:metal-sulfur cluster biosynthetic enzyme